LAGVEVGQQDHEPAGRRGQVPGQLADLRFQPLQRHRGRPGGRAVGGGASMVIIEHVFEANTLV
jgi:hypothetical protein